MENWRKDKDVAERPVLPAVVIWSIWLERNKITFEDNQPSLHKFCVESNTFMMNPKGCYKENIRQVTEVIIAKTLHWVFFYSASNGNSGACGAGGVIYLTDDHKFLFTCGLGEGLNNWAEVY